MPDDDVIPPLALRLGRTAVEDAGELDRRPEVVGPRPGLAIRRVRGIPPVVAITNVPSNQLLPVPSPPSIPLSFTYRSVKRCSAPFAIALGSLLPSARCCLMI